MKEGMNEKERMNGRKNDWWLERKELKTRIDEYLPSDVMNIERKDEWRKSEMMYETNTNLMM